MQPSLRIAIDATPLLGTRTGVGAFVDGLVHALEQKPLDICAFAVTWKGRRDLAAFVPASVRTPTRPMVARPLHLLWRHLDTAYAAPIEWWTGPIDVVHGTNFVVPPALHAGRIVTVHDLTAWRYPEMCTPHTLHYPRLVARAWASGAWIHTPSAFVAAELADVLPGSPQRIVAVHHGIPPVTRGNASSGQAIAGAERYVLSLGTIEPRKDLPTLVKAFDAAAAELPDLRLVIAGPDGWGTQALAAALDRATHRDRVRRLGFVSPGMRADLLAGAAIFAYPSIYEGFGFPPLEAMAVGTPVVSTRAGSLPEILSDAATLVPTGDADALAQEILRLATDAEARKRLVTAGHKRVEKYSWQSCATGLAALYRHAANNA